MMLQLQIIDNTINIIQNGDYVSGTVQSQPIQFLFNDAWHELIKVASFKSGTLKIDVALTPDENSNYIIMIPHKLLAIKGKIVSVGVIGVKNDAIVLPTPYLTLGQVVQGTEISGISPSEPTPPIYAEMIENIANIQAIAESVRTDADNGVFDGIDGIDGTDGYTPQKNIDYWTPEDITEIQSYIGDAIPTNVSAFTNDVGYLTEHQSLADYATKEEVNKLEAMTVSAESVTTETPASVEKTENIDGTYNFHFQIPSGVDGINGTDGTNGVDGREIEFNVSATAIQWRYVGDTTWIDLISLLAFQAITDNGGYYTSDNVEDALQEIGAELSGINTLIGTGVIA